ncbi:MAG: ATP-binding cassette domain-containing protein [Nitrospiraceae bacterium]|nr:MAG: ATP-binding cassette domain-containing protein [Nitrospiraceae bacterium]
MISVNNVTKYFGDRAAVNDVSFTVNKGEILGFLGPNGAGKTTTLRIMTGFFPPSQGTVTIDGQDVFEHPYEIKKKIGYMPEHPPLYYDMSARECLSFVAEIHGLRGSAAGSAIRRVSELCGITHMLDRLTGNLSKGYRQRVGLAHALIHDPAILILDEPTSGLDPMQIIEIRELIKNLGRERTVILSSHILFEVTNVCKRVAIINNGRIVAVDTIEKLSDKFGKGKQIVLTVTRPERMDLKKLSSIDGVIDAVQDNGGRFTVSISGGDNVLERISSEVVSMQAGLIEMKHAAMTLEEIFLKTVSGG